MHLRKKITGLIAGTGILILILDSETALSGAAAGLSLCLKTVIPSLFPFLFLCALLTGSLWGVQASWIRKVGRRLGIPEGAESILISAVLGGYPAGAQTIGNACQTGLLSPKDAQHLLTFCSNAGPAFLFGMTSSLFPNKKMVWALWMIQLLSAALTAVSGHHTPESSATLPGVEPSVSDLLVRTVRVMAVICSWVLLFRVLTGFLERWILFRLPVALQVLITGLLELSNGCISLHRIDSIFLRFLLCSLFLSWGGLCVTMQTTAVIGSLSPVSYLTGKLRQSTFSVVLSVLYLYTGWWIPAAFSMILFLFPNGIKKRSGFPSVSGV